MRQEIDKMDSIFKLIAKVADLFDTSYDPKKARRVIFILIISKKYQLAL